MIDSIVIVPEPLAPIVGLAVLSVVGSALVFVWLHGYGRGHAAASRNTMRAIAEERHRLMAVTTQVNELSDQIDAMFATGEQPSAPRDNAA